MYKITNANIKEWAKNYDGPQFDGILCDPPYELGFMGKSWDSSGIAFDTEMWADIFKLLKPGGHLLAFSGSRTYHRMAVAIEDAGFEIRDMIEWVYGSGFPKSLNIGKAVDKIEGNEREIIGRYTDPQTGKEYHQTGNRKNFTSGNASETENCKDERFIVTKGTSEWEGYGTALKPAHESVCVAQKPLETCTETEYIISICQKLFAQIATNRSMLNPQEQKEVSSIVQWLAENNINTLEDLSEAMAILQSCIKGVTSLNIVWLWLITLAESWQAMNTSTISTRLNMTTELKILDSLEWASILRSIMLPKNNKADGLSANVYNADSLLNAVRLKLQDTLTHFAQEPVISKAEKQGLLPKSEPCVLARKPLDGTVANNVLKHGTGGLNIDGSRVGTEQMGGGTMPVIKGSNNFSSREPNADRTEYNNYATGRFPANLIHDGSDEVEAVFPNSKGGGFPKTNTNGSSIFGTVGIDKEERVNMNDSGSASRFFYTAKASKSERNAGLEGFENHKPMYESHRPNYENTKGIETPYAGAGRTGNANQNHHPTVKPLSLTKYLATLIKPPTGGRLLVPFSGSGSEMIGALQAGWEYVEGVELTEEYIPIAEARIKYWLNVMAEEEKQPKQVSLV